MSLDGAGSLAMVETALDTPPLGGLSQDRNGKFFLSELETNALTRIEKDGSRTILVQDRELVWIDAPLLAEDGYVHAPAAQASRMAPSRRGRLRPPTSSSAFAIGLDEQHLAAGGNPKDPGSPLDLVDPVAL